MNFKLGNVLLAEVVFSDATGSKKRPSLIISGSEFNRNRNEIIISAITSNIDRKLPGDTKIRDWEQAGLLFPSIATGIIQTLHKDLFLRELGKLSSEDLQRVKTNLQGTLDL
jgi:mRNA interferase MazF